MGSPRYGLLAALVAAALPVGAQVPRRALCRTQCAFELRLRAGGCCPARAPPPSGPERCAEVAPERATCETTTAAARPRYEAPAWVLERRPAQRRSKELILSAIRVDGPRLVAGPLRDPAMYAAATMRLVEDYDDLAAMQQGAASELDVPHGSPAAVETARSQQEALLSEARQYREQLIRAVQRAIERAPNASVADQLLFRMAVAQAALARHDDARRTYHMLLQRFPQSPYVPHAYLAFAEHFFAEREWEPAAQFYERARLPADPTNHARAYALYRLAWTRLLSGSFAASLARFDEALAWANAHHDAPDIARLAEAARVEREVAAWAAAPGRTVAATRSAPEADARREAMAQAADALQAAGDWWGAVALYRRLLAQHPLDARYCAWRAAAARAMDCLVAPPRDGSAP